MVKVDVKEHSSLWQTMNLEAVPSIYTFENGKLCARTTGLKTTEEYTEFLKQGCQ